MSFRSTMSSPKAQRRLLWVGSVVIAVGVAVAVVILVGDTGTARPEVIEQEPAIVSQEGPKAPLPKEARKVAGEFILTAVNRKNLARSWDITHPTLREGLTKKEWLTGNIPVVPYPVSSTDPAPMSVEESYAN